VPAGSVAPGVPGVVVVDGSGVVDDWVSVGKDKPGRVGGSVEVTKRGGASDAGSCASFTQELTARLRSTMNIQSFFMRRFYLAIMKQF
jgi:hypothetical protein